MCRMIYIIANGQQNVAIFLGHANWAPSELNEMEKVSKNIENVKLSYVNVEMLYSVKELILLFSENEQILGQLSSTMLPTIQWLALWIHSHGWPYRSTFACILFTFFYLPDSNAEHLEQSFVCFVVNGSFHSEFYEMHSNETSFMFSLTLALALAPISIDVSCYQVIVCCQRPISIKIDLATVWFLILVSNKFKYMCHFFVRINLNFSISFSFSVSFWIIAIATGITQAQKYEILEAHNRLRSQVAQGRVSGQPGAQNMREMVWDEELAVRAQQWANQCIFEHDPSRSTSKNFFPSLIRYELFLCCSLTFCIDAFAWLPQFNMSHRPKANLCKSKSINKTKMTIHLRNDLFPFFVCRSFYNGPKFGNYLEYSTISSRWCNILIAYPKLVQRSSSIRMGIRLGTKNRPLLTSMYTIQCYARQQSSHL